jgi:exodeoxyribonuclease VII large subunit
MQRQRLDGLRQRLAAANRALLDGRHHRLSEAWSRLIQRSPQHLARDCGQREEVLRGRLEHAVAQYLSRLSHRVMLAKKFLDTASPLATLARGFAIVTRPDGALVSDASGVAPGEEIEARLASGRLRARVTQSHKS